MVLIFYWGSSLPLDSYISKYLSLLFMNDLGIPLNTNMNQSDRSLRENLINISTSKQQTLEMLKLTSLLKHKFVSHAS